MTRRYASLCLLLLAGLFCPLRADEVPTTAPAPGTSENSDSPGIFDEEAPDEWAQKYPPKPTTVNRVMLDLNQESQDAWRNNKPWPRAKPDYARRMNVTLSNEDLARVLGQSLHNNPALNGYIKWQLLSFKPTLADLSIQSYRQIIATMPDPLRQPEPYAPASAPAPAGGGFGLTIGTQIALVEPYISYGRPGYRLHVLTTGSGLSIGGDAGWLNDNARLVIAVAETTQRETVRVRRIINDLNQPTLDYRSRLMEILPSAGGVRLFACITDILDRCHAGDPTWTKAVERMVKEAQKLGPNPALNEEIKPLIVGGLRQLINYRKTVTRSLSVDNAGQVTLEQELLCVPRGDLVKVIASLNLSDVVRVP